MDLEAIERTVARLHDQETTFDWVGVYLVAASGETEVVPDVRRRPGHIACDIQTRSEVVAPILRDGRVAGVLDVDSNTLDAFGPSEVKVVEEAAGEIAARN